LCVTFTDSDYDYLRDVDDDDDETRKHEDIYNDVSFDYGSRKCMRRHSSVFTDVSLSLLSTCRSCRVRVSVVIEQFSLINLWTFAVTK